jgi:TusE/DsrC/DsvC family sulfur relay protein
MPPVSLTAAVALSILITTKSDPKGQAAKRAISGLAVRRAEEKLMRSTQIAGRQVQLNLKGHLARFDEWDEDIAIGLAEGEGLTLSECHWVVIGFLRDYYATFEHPPSPRLVVRGIGAQLTLNGPCTRKTLETLFPDGGCKQACRVAGLPDYYCPAC